MLSDKVLMELARSSPLRSELLKAAWPALSTESKLQLIDAVSTPAGSPHTPEDVGDLALNDPAPIVRYWAARFYYFRRLRVDQDGRYVGFSEPTPEEMRISAKADADDCALVQSAAKQGGIGFGNLIELPQLARLVALRRASYPSTAGFAHFIESAVAKGGASVQEVRECIWEYFAREDVRHELDELDDDGYSEFSKTGGYKLLWTIAATAPIGIAVVIARHAALKGKYWKIELPQLLALPDEIKEVVVSRIEEPVEQLRQVVRASPDKYSKELVDAVASHDRMQADPDGREYSEQELLEFRLEDMPNRQHAVFLSVKKLREEVSQLMEAFAEVPKQADLDKTAQQILSRVLWVGIGLAMFLYAMLRTRLI
jgi:hypothetical protein